MHVCVHVCVHKYYELFRLECLKDECEELKKN